jgi:hypothetical protein
LEHKIDSRKDIKYYYDYKGRMIYKYAAAENRRSKKGFPNIYNAPVFHDMNNAYGKILIMFNNKYIIDFTLNSIKSIVYADLATVGQRVSLTLNKTDIFSCPVPPSPHFHHSVNTGVSCYWTITVVR